MSQDYAVIQEIKASSFMCLSSAASAQTVPTEPGVKLGYINV